MRMIQWRILTTPSAVKAGKGVTGILMLIMGVQI